MTYRGIIQDGVIRPYEPVDLPDGTEVVFNPVVNGEVPAHGDGRGLSEADLKEMNERFWKNEPLEEQIRRSGVEPVRNIAELSGGRSDDEEKEDVDEFLRSIREWRR